MTHDRQSVTFGYRPAEVFSLRCGSISEQRRFDRKRTWRKLTVADDLRIVSDAEAVGFRVQVGSEQWMMYRSLANQINRSVLGKHLVADFFAARFYASDGSFEELVTVDDNEPDDE